MKTLICTRVLLAAVLVLGLLSCDIFLTAKEGRWNPLDPNNELEVIVPETDGYALSSLDDAAPVLIAAPGAKAIVMSFDTADFPEELGNVYLKLYHVSAPGSGIWIRIHPIAQVWPSPLPFSAVETPGVFYYPEAVVLHLVSIEPGWEIIDLSEIVDGDEGNIKHGIVIFSESIHIEFESTEAEDFHPHLLVEAR